MSRIHVRIEAAMPPLEVEAFLRTVRAWEGARPEIEMAIVIDDPTNELKDAEGMLRRLSPELPHVTRIDRKS
jgi:hypothetical protein